MEQINKEQVLYSLPQKKSRVIIPKIVSLISLGIIFYLGILINLSLLKLAADEEMIVKISSLGILILIIVVGIIFSIIGAKKTYQFYHNKLIFNRKEINYLEINNTNPKKDLMDRIFKTYSINLGQQFVMRNISTEIDMGNYLQQLISYAKQKK